MKEELLKILENAKKDFEMIKDNKLLEEFKVKYLGKKGFLKEVLSKIGELSDDLKKEIGKISNEVKDEINKMIQEAEIRIKNYIREEKLKVGVSDISVPKNVPDFGYYHPLTLVTKRMVDIFIKLGYTIEEGPELEDEIYNFDLLNIPPYHPARDDHDSFYICKGKLMRTHTSPVQIRTMKKKKPPIAIIVPGKCFRRDAVDATHSHTFHQMEGLVVDKNVTFADLKGTLLMWAKMMFGEETNIRLRPDHFPFTEPSAELAVTCPVCKGAKCHVCKNTGWVEIMGCGMVEPNVLKNCDIDPDKYSGFAFGLGIERVAMVVYGIKDIRQFYENDMRLLQQFIK